MPTFTYRVATPEGATHEGRRISASSRDLRRELRQKDLLLLDLAVEEERDGGTLRGLLPLGRRREVARLVRYLATLLNASFPLDRALRTAAGVASRAEIADAVASVRRDIRDGAALSDALAARPDQFPGLATGMIRAGERGGHLPEALDRLASHLERTVALRARISSALVYPAFMIFAGLASVVVLVMYVLPRFTEVLAEAGVELPMSTRLLLDATDLAGTWWPLLALSLAALGWGIVRYVRTDAGALRLHVLLRRLPVIGPLRGRLAAANTGRTLGTLLEGGVPVLAAIGVTADSVGDRVAARELRAARDGIRSGGRLAAALGSGSAFPDVFLQMVRVGEEGGRLPELLERGADLMEEELELGLERLVSLIEPAVILVFGALVGFIALSLLQAVYGIHGEGLGG